MAQRVIHWNFRDGNLSRYLEQILSKEHKIITVVPIEYGDTGPKSMEIIAATIVVDTNEEQKAEKEFQENVQKAWEEREPD